MSANKTPSTVKQPSCLLLHSTTQSHQCYKLFLLDSAFTHASNCLKLLESLGKREKYLGPRLGLVWPLMTSKTKKGKLVQCTSPLVIDCHQRLNRFFILYHNNLIFFPFFGSFSVTPYCLLGQLQFLSLQFQFIG